MSLAQRFERRLESLVGGAFARVFKGQVEPVEVASALQREASDKRSVMGNGQVFAPNRYRVTLGPTDHERLYPWEKQLANSLAELVQEHLDENGWTTIGDIEVYLALDANLRTGVFGVASRMASDAGPRRRPQDSLSLPVVAGREPDDYSPPAPYVPPIPAYQPPPPYQPPPAYQSPPAYQPPPTFQPPPKPIAELVVEETSQRLSLNVGSNLIGRGSDATLQLLDQGVSRRHIDVQYDGSNATVYDLGSTNGTQVNGHQVSSQLLRHGDVVRIGHSKLVFHQDDPR